MFSRRQKIAVASSRLARIEYVRPVPVALAVPGASYRMDGIRVLRRGESVSLALR
ncbi:MAG: hypothetical protein ACR2K2_14830 [Mycobacteriales bacterium]